MKVDVLHSDESLLIVNKPEFVRSVPAAKDASQPNVLQSVQQQFPAAMLVHRLDMDTSGLMIFAMGAESQRELNSQFQRKQIRKQYTAVVAGHPTERWGCIDLPIIKDWPNRPRQRIDFQRGKSALSYYRVDQKLWQPMQAKLEDAAVSRLTLFPETGRSHQLRIHLRCLGHPLAGCDLYGTEHSYGLSSRLLLHASRLEFPHPDTGEMFTIECPAPF